MDSIASEPYIVNTFLGKAGHFMVIMAFMSTILASLAYFLSVRNENDPERKLSFRKAGRIVFGMHSAAILGIVTVLFIMIFTHRFEYHYVWQHSDRNLDLKYILSCFWEGQEGSFLLWGFWHMVLGWVVIFKSGKWEARLMAILMSIQFFILSFLLGFHFGDFRIGNSPFLMIGDVLTQDPVFLFEDYMRFIRDGTGLNALLQNYWMVIHPPVLFLGFASVTIPFAYAVSSLWSRDYKDWIRDALPFTLFAVMILGTGILMGGAWAYESLSFGGFWAWDPVENASFVPWLILVGGLHTMVAGRHTGHSIRTSYVLVILSFFFILWSSFLTRSGVLGDTSVHAFVVNGLTKHLLVFNGFFLILSFLMLAVHWRYIPSPQKEEETSSREFWMFIASLVFLFSALHIIFFTSVPVYNKIFARMNMWFGLSLKDNFAPPVDPVAYYNSVQIWVAILLSFLVGLIQYLKYKKTKVKTVLKHHGISFLVALAGTLFFIFSLDFEVLVKLNLKLFGNTYSLKSLHPHIILLFTSIFAFVANFWYLIAVLKGKINVSGASIAHAGFGIMLLGILISNGKQFVISENRLGIDYGEQFDQAFKRDNILLYKNMPQKMGDFIATYVGDSVHKASTFYRIDYKKVDDETGEVKETFSLYPYLLMDKKSQQLTPNPDTKKYLTRDIFTHISSVPRKNAASKDPLISEHTVTKGDTIFYSLGYMVLEDFKRYPAEGDTLVAGAVFDLHFREQVRIAEPKMKIIGADIIPAPFKLDAIGLQVYLANILPETNEFVIAVVEDKSASDWVIMKAIVFPYIKLVWWGTIILVIGFLISIRKRYFDKRRPAALS